MKKKVFSIFLAALMIVLMLPTQAFATEEMVYFSISDDGAYVYSDTKQIPLAYVEIPISEIKEIDIEEYGLGEYATDNNKDGEDDITVLHLYIYAHEKYYYEGADPLVENAEGAPGSIFFKWFWGHDCNLNYYVNGEYPLAYDGWGATADTIVIEPGDFVDIMMFSSWDFYSDSGAGFHNFFDENGIVHEMTFEEGEEAEFMLKRGYGNINIGGATMYDPVPNVPVYYSQSGVYAEDALETESDENGNISITFPSSGTWYVWMDGQKGIDFPDAVVSSPAYLEITVESSIVKGDISGDGEVAPADAAFAYAAYNGAKELSDEQKAAADVNGDGEITPADAALIYAFYNGKITEFPSGK